MIIVHDYLSKKLPEKAIGIRLRDQAGHYIDLKVTKKDREAFRVLLNSECFGDNIFCFSKKFGLSARQLAIIVGSLER